MRFPVYVHKGDKGGYGGFIPDIPGCYFAGDSFEAAIADADSAVDAHLEYQAEKGGEMPVARSIDEHLNDEDCTGGYWAFIDVDMGRYNGRSVKLNITLPESLLLRIDSYVKTHKGYGSRSGFFAELASREMNSAG